MGRQSPLTSQKFVNLLITPTPPPCNPNPLLLFGKTCYELLLLLLATEGSMNKKQHMPH